MLRILVPSKPHFTTIINVVLYLTLFIFFVNFYLYGQVTEFLKGGTTFTRTFAHEDGLALPSIILCMPGSKKSTVGVKYGNYTSVLSVLFDQNEVYKKFNKTPLQVAEEMSFLLDRDFQMDINYFLDKSYPLKMGLKNKVKDGYLMIKYIWTTSGLCYLLESTYKLQKNHSTWFELQIRPKQSYYDSMNHDQTVELYFAANNTWQGIYLISWHYFKVPKIFVRFDPSLQTLVDISPSLIKFQNGVKDVNQCMASLLKNINCSQLCYTIAFNLMSEVGWTDCKTYKAMNCIHNNGPFHPLIENQLGLCLRPAQAMVFKGQVMATRPAFDESYIGIWFKYSTGQLEVKEEIPILGVATFIGSIGGSLGLFLGFSCYDYFSNLMRKIATIFYNTYEK